MKQPKTRITMKHYKIYLIFMLVAARLSGNFSCQI